MGFDTRKDIAITSYAVDDGGSGGYNRTPVDNDSEIEKDQKAQRKATGSTYSYYKEREIGYWANKVSWGESNTANTQSAATLISDYKNSLLPAASVNIERDLSNVLASRYQICACGGGGYGAGGWSYGSGNGGKNIGAGAGALALGGLIGAIWNWATGSNADLTENNNGSSSAAPETNAGAAATPAPMGPPEDPNKKKQEEFASEALCEVAGSPVCPSATPTTQWNNGRQYGVVYQMELPQEKWINTRDVHFEEANKSLYQETQRDKDFDMYIYKNFPKVHGHIQPRADGSFLDSSPSGFTWHHSTSKQAFGVRGVMQLVNADDHSRGNFTLYHPLVNGKNSGGCKEWGGGC